jgi:4-amino-4-deoxy-L-arabinose transferase-like glycosyltransferase
LTDNNKSRRDLLVLAVLALCVFLPGLGNRALWNPDEPRYGEVAREMQLTGEWFVPHLNGEIYAQKPPLLMWLMNAASLVTAPGGSDALNEWSVRLPSALSAVAAILLTFLITRRLASRRAAWMAAVAFGTCSKILWQGRTGQIDMLLTALVALAVWLWVRGYTEGRPGFYRLFFLTTGFATLAKGPVGLLPPLLSVVAFLLLSGERGEIRRMRIGTGLLIWAAVVLAWLVPAGFEAGRPYLETMVFKQNVTRYADPWHHFRPPWYYLTVLPADFFPWATLLPSALVVGWRRFFRSSPGSPEDPRRRAFLFGLSWMIVTLVFFSISPAKRTVYILTMYPAMALLVGMALDRWARVWDRRDEADRGWLLWPLGLLTLVAVAIPVAVPFVAAHRADELEPMGPGMVPRGVAVFSFLALGAVAAVWLALRGRVRPAAYALAGGCAVMGLGVFLVLLPRFDAVKSARPLSRILLERMEPGEPYAIYPRLDAPFLFYTGRFSEEIWGEEELQRYVESPGRKWLLIERDDLAELAEPLPLVEVARDGDRRDGYILMTDPPAPAP